MALMQQVNSCPSPGPLLQILLVSLRMHFVKQNIFVLHVYHYRKDLTQPVNPHRKD